MRRVDGMTEALDDLAPTLSLVHHAENTICWTRLLEQRVDAIGGASMARTR